MDLSLSHNDALEGSWEIEVHCRYFGGLLYDKAYPKDTMIVVTSLFLKKRMISYSEMDLFCFSVLYLMLEKDLTFLNRDYLKDGSFTFDLDSLVSKNVVVLGFLKSEVVNVPTTCTNLLYFARQSRKSNFNFKVCHDFHLKTRETVNPSVILAPSRSARLGLIFMTRSEVKRAMHQLKGLIDAAANLSLDESFTVIESDNSVNLTLEHSKRKPRDSNSLDSSLNEPKDMKSLSSSNNSLYVSSFNAPFEPQTIVKSSLLTIFLIIIALSIFSVLQFYFLKWLENLGKN